MTGIPYAGSVAKTALQAENGDGVGNRICAASDSAHLGNDTFSAALLKLMSKLLRILNMASAEACAEMATVMIAVAAVQRLEDVRLTRRFRMASQQLRIIEFHCLTPKKYWGGGLFIAEPPRQK